MRLLSCLGNIKGNRKPQQKSRSGNGFISKRMMARITTNLSASELEFIYGNRIRSRMHEIFNLEAFNRDSKDKRK